MTAFVVVAHCHLIAMLHCIPSFSVVAIVGLCCIIVVVVTATVVVGRQSQMEGVVKRMCDSQNCSQNGPLFA
jgi:hypothetical protein